MKLKPDLIRVLLLYAESLGKRKETDLNALVNNDYLKNYSWGELFSAISILGSDDANLFDGAVILKLGGSQLSHIGPLTSAGTDYLMAIKDNQLWERVKEKTGPAPGSVTITDLFSIASDLTSPN